MTSVMINEPLRTLPAFSGMADGERSYVNELKVMTSSLKCFCFLCLAKSIENNQKDL